MRRWIWHSDIKHRFDQSGCPEFYGTGNYNYDNPGVGDGRAHSDLGVGHGNPAARGTNADLPAILVGLMMSERRS